jgi:hypothetical protein
MANIPSPIARAKAMSGTARDEDRNAKLMALLGLSAKYDHNGEDESDG